MNLDIMDSENDRQHPTTTYSLFNQSIIEKNQVQTQQAEMNTYLPIACDPSNNQPISFPKSEDCYTQQWNYTDTRLQDKQWTEDTTHIANSNKHLEENTILITPHTNRYLENNPTTLQYPNFDKSSQTDLSFSNKPHTIKSSTYSAIHTTLSLLKSMDQPDGKTNNNAEYILRTQNTRQKLLHDLNMEMAKINNTEAQRYYTINCAKNGTFTKTKETESH